MSNNLVVLNYCFKEVSMNLVPHLKTNKEVPNSNVKPRISFKKGEIQNTSFHSSQTELTVFSSDLTGGV